MCQGTFGVISDKDQTGDDLASGILVTWEVMLHHLRPVFGDIEEIFDIELDLLKEAPLSFDF